MGESNATAWWGHHDDLLTEPKQRDPNGALHTTIDYPGIPVDCSSIIESHDILKNEISPRGHTLASLPWPRLRPE